MTHSNLRTLLRCPRCPGDEAFEWDDRQGVCKCGYEIRVENGLIYYTSSDDVEHISEMKVRDQQASSYLKHSKFPIQIFRVRQFLTGLPHYVKGRPVFELACGPGPYTRMLLESSYDVIGIDFSEKSLLINRSRIADASRACYVRADLNSLRMERTSSNLLFMADFLQHLGDYELRRAFLSRAFEWLSPGGFFYLSFFNFNVKNYLKGDLHGAFASGGIKYERLLYKEVLNILPGYIRVDSVMPVNIFHSVMPDRVASKLPGAKFLARMIAMHGRRMDG